MRPFNSRDGDRKRNWPVVPAHVAAVASSESPALPPAALATKEVRVQKIIRMVETGPARTIRDLALEIHLSPSRLQWLFKHETGIPMGEWLSEQRLQRAAQLLEKSHLSVKEIAHSVGYGHPSSFIRAFERRYGLAPARYRKQIAQHEMLTNTP